MKDIAIFLFIIFTVNGCASSVGWGKKFEVLHKNSKSITVKYDSVLADFSDFSSVVDDHCEKYGKEAVPDERKDSQSNSVFGGIQTVTFLCEK